MPGTAEARLLALTGVDCYCTDVSVPTALSSDPVAMYLEHGLNSADTVWQRFTCADKQRTHLDWEQVSEWSCDRSCDHM